MAKKGGRLSTSLLLVIIVVIISIYSIAHMGENLEGGESGKVEPTSLLSRETELLAERLTSLEALTEKAWNELTKRKNDLAHITTHEINPVKDISIIDRDQPLEHASNSKRETVLQTTKDSMSNIKTTTETNMEGELTPLTDWRGHGKCGKDGIVAVTYASHGGRDDRFCRAVESALRQNIPWEVLGWGVKWQGLSQKLQASLDYAKTLDPECILLFSDAFDVLFTQDLIPMKQSFQAAGHSLLFAGECGCWPQVVQDEKRGFKKKSGHICNHLYPPSPTPYRFLNSGLWMGYASRAVSLLEAVVDQVVHSKAGMKTNDQELVSDMYIDHKFNISLDWYSTVFQCMHETGSAPLPNCNPSKHVTFQDGKWFNKLTKTNPAVFHFNGGGKAHHLNMEAHLPYMSKSENEKEEEAIYATRLRFNGKMIPFGKICPNHLSKSRGKRKHR